MDTFQLWIYCLLCFAFLGALFSVYAVSCIVHCKIWESKNFFFLGNSLWITFIKYNSEGNSYYYWTVAGNFLEICFTKSGILCCVYILCSVWLFATPGTISCQASLSMGLSRQECWRGMPFPFPRKRYLPHPAIKPTFPASPALAAHSLPLSHLGSPCCVYNIVQDPREVPSM